MAKKRRPTAGEIIDTAQQGARYTAQNLKGQSGVAGRVGQEAAGAIKVFTEMVEAAKTIFKTFESVLSGVGTVVSGVGNIFSALIDVTAAVVKTFLAFSLDLAAAGLTVVGLGAALVAMVPLIGGIGEVIGNLAASVIGALVNVVGNLIGSVIDSITRAFEKLVEGITKIFEGLLNAGMNLIKGLIEMAFQISNIIFDLTGFIDQLVKGRRQYAIWNSQLLLAFQGLGWARFQRNREVGVQTGESGAGLIAVLNRLEQTFQPILISLTNAMNRLGIYFGQLVTDLIAWVSPMITNFLNKIDFSSQDFIDKLNLQIIKIWDALGLFIRWINAKTTLLLIDLNNWLNKWIDGINSLIGGMNFVVDAINLLIKVLYYTTPILWAIWDKAPQVGKIPEAPKVDLPRVDLPNPFDAGPPPVLPRGAAPPPPPPAPKWNGPVIVPPPVGGWGMPR